jgi:DNA modification methylase
MAALGVENTVLHGNGARMDVLADGQADLVFTSPPYFSDSMFVELAVPKSKQTDIKRIENNILSFARTLRPVFTEIARVLKAGRALVIQTKDIRYGDFLIPLSDAHLSVASSCGFHLVTRISWVPSKSKPKRRPAFLMSQKVGQFQSYDSEVFLVLAKEGGLERRGKIESGSEELWELAKPLWRMPFRRRRDDHPYVSPRPVVRELILLLTERGDLVVDPFAGFGTVIDVAKSVGRFGIGWDINQHCVKEANRRLL